ncbi:MAG: hypothetical protein AAF636_10545 [Pseudomonadota bacterium]
MSAKSLYGMILSVSNIIRDLETAGMRVEVGDDFSEYRNLRHAQEDRPMYPMFDVASSYVDQSNGFWVCGFDKDDNLIHTQAIRLLDLTGVSLRQHMRVHRHKYITPNTTPDPDRTFYTQPPALRTISGKVCYHGDFWLKGGDEGHRSQGLTPLLSRIVFELALKTWAPNYIFAFVSKPVASKGMHFRCGYNHCEPGCWIGPDNQVTDEDCLIWMTTKDLIHFIESEPHSLAQETKSPISGSSLRSVGIGG